MTTNKIKEAIQQDLDTGLFLKICSNETTFKEYVFPLINLSIQQGREEEREACARIVERYYTECDTCRVKPGSPILCQGCLNSRDSITAAIRARGQGNEKTV